MPGSSSKAVPLCSKPPVCSARHLAAPSIGKKGGSSLNVLGVGSGSGKIDLEILGKIQSKHPGFFIHNEVVEPNPQHISKYKALVKEWNSGPNISFTWNQMTSGEYEKQNKKRNESKKFDFIHMIEMLYYVESLHDTIKYFHSLLETNGKLLIVQTADDGGYHSLWRKAGSRFLSSCLFLDVHKVLDEMRMKYHIYELSSIFDITECFIEGNENGELLLDFLTHIVDFRKSAPAGLKAEVLQCLRQPQCSREENGKILFNNNLYFIVIDY
ncbi:histamine N-methyltransferase-like isoform X2 [Chiloscyllium plagiosum]|uniref:histamine N-methyltransferase-like isoform X2 n=1 Tax=Chiloscyllium plagiosum TaxID=36176 RepID=UPI001CB81619|nr:histamine N-methyltransferase-like isoform X2 [Chiloscyllium plagiosum]XP_043550007.1 histamine N-methyltransferase-like isoform X2 [Chiloscyllium plagiosum]